MVKITSIFLSFMVVFTGYSMEPKTLVHFAHMPTIGWLSMITGPMFSGKSEELIKRINRFRLMNMRVDVFKPSMDSRCSNIIFSRVSKQEVAAFPVPVDKPDEILNHIDYRFSNVVAIDEVQFFDRSIVSVIERLLANRIQVVIAGLDRDFKGDPFGESMPELLIMSDECKKLAAICNKCKMADASLTQRLIKGRPASKDSPLVLVDNGKDDVTYEPRCRSCHQLPDTSAYNSILRSPEVDFTAVGWNHCSDGTE